MKNLKKVLAVVLVVCMAFSLMAFTGAANVKDYSDASSIKQTEAVDLFSALGFLAGSDGKFNPAGNITREQAAKIITYMLIGSVKADALTSKTSNFSDVAVSRWSAPYIQYCAAAGIINGLGDGKFNPEGNVTGTQFAKMLLVSVGYGKNGEYTGANWEMTVIADATSLNIFSLDVDVTAAATREQCAQYGFNAYIKCNMVVYNSNTKSYQLAQALDGVSMKGTLAFQQGVGKATAINIDGVMNYKWAKDGKDITGYYVDEKVIGKSANGTAIADLKDAANPAFIAQLETSATYTAGIAYINGALKDLSVGADLTAVNTAVAKKGVVVEFVDTDTVKDNKADYLRITEDAAVKLSGAPIVTNGLVTIAGITGLSSVVSGKVFGYEGLADKDIVLWHKDNQNNFHIQKAATITGNMASYISGNRFTVGTTLYKHSDLTLPSGYAKTTINDAWMGANCTVYLDNGGFAVYAKSDSAAISNPASSYAFVMINAGADAFGVIKVKLAFSDGTTSVVSVNSQSTVANPTVNQFYKFTVASDGTYKFTALTGAYSGATVAGTEAGMTAGLTYQNNYTYNATTRVHVINNSVAKYITDTKDTGAAGDDTVTNQTANADTRFVYTDTTPNPDKNYAYTGIANAPTFTEAAGTDLIYTLSVATSATASTAIFVYATGASTFATGVTTGTWVYVINNVPTIGVDANGVTTHTYTAEVNGVITPLTVAAADDFVTTVGVYLVNKYDANGYAKTAILAGSTSPASANYAAMSGVTATTVGYASGNITVTNSAAPYAVNRALGTGAKVWFVDTTKLTSDDIIVISQIDPSQLNALTSAAGYNVTLIDTSTTDTSVGTVIVMGSTT